MASCKMFFFALWNNFEWRGGGRCVIYPTDMWLAAIWSKKGRFLCQRVSTFLQLFVVAREKLQKEARPCPESVVFPLKSNSFFWKITEKNIKRIGSQQWFPQHQKTPFKIHSETLRFCRCLELVVNLMNITLVSTKCRLQTAADHCLHHSNENVATIISLFCNTENNGLQSAFCTGRFKSRTGSTRTASPGQINSDRLGPTRIE